MRHAGLEHRERRTGDDDTLDAFLALHVGNFAVGVDVAETVTEAAGSRSKGYLLAIAIRGRIANLDKHHAAKGHRTSL
jgi:hypothetical protein